MTTTTGDTEEEGMISAKMLATASDIFGNKYLNFIGEEEDNNDELEDDDHQKKFRERGIGVTLAIDSDEEIVESSSSKEEKDDDLFTEGGQVDGKLKRKLERREK